ncbi:alpha/beta hydrolase [Candidatus Uhrbacteria bacterium]|nr:alpha/beta hydrolase [Candidatus Uhrbacteria bacterium]
MPNPRPHLVLFPGAWGNRTHELAAWWFRHVIAHFRRDYEIVLLTYQGTGLDDYIDTALEQLKAVPDGSYAICYSMGSQIARGVAAQRPKLFKRVALLSGLERIGVRFVVFLRALTFMLKPMLRTLLGKPLMLDTVRQVRRVFLREVTQRIAMSKVDLAKAQREQDVVAQNLLDHRLQPEPAGVVLRLFLPGLRRRYPAFPCPVMAVVPSHDFILPNTAYPGEQVQKVAAMGDHALFALNDNGVANSYLSRIANWFTLN